MLLGMLFRFGGAYSDGYLREIFLVTRLSLPLHCTTCATPQHLTTAAVAYITDTVLSFSLISYWHSSHRHISPHYFLNLLLFLHQVVALPLLAN
jgi:hypothetical protein